MTGGGKNPRNLSFAETFEMFRSSVSNQDSASGFQGFRRNRQKLPERSSRPQLYALVAI